MSTVVGWDVGGVNTKAAWLAHEQGAMRRWRVASQVYEIWRDKDRLGQVLRSVLARVAPGVPEAMALTMTAELSDAFASKREGVLFVLDSVAAAFPGCPTYALSLNGEFVALEEARARPADLAAANWLATALFVAERIPRCLLVDVGSTTSDIVPILDGRVASLGRSDPERLALGELVYTGILRTHLAAIVHAVPLRGQACRVSSEYFCTSGDVHLILGHLQPGDYTCPTADGRPATVEYARARLARLVCADLEMLDPREVDVIARHVHKQQLRQIEGALSQVLSRLAIHGPLSVVAVGLGAILARQAAGRLGLSLLDPGMLGDSEASAVAPCVAAAHLLADRLEAGV